VLRIDAKHPARPIFDSAAFSTITGWMSAATQPTKTMSSTFIGSFEEFWG
jgi:hypothetical protein